MGLANFKSVWRPDSDFCFSYSDDEAGFDDSLPHLGHVKQKDASDSHQTEHIHHVSLHIDPFNRRGGAGAAKRRREALQRARRKRSGQENNYQ